MTSTSSLEHKGSRRWWHRRPGILGLAIFALLLPIIVVPSSAVASSCNPSQNAIVCENSKPGSPWDEWEVTGAGDDSIQGFATDISVNVGHTVDFKIDTDATDYSIDIYRTGWYQGLGARKIASVSPSAHLPQKQPECLSDVSTELTDCGTWAVSASWSVPADAVSGVYIAKLTRKDTGGASHITFIVRNEASSSAVLFQTSDPTWHAYNTYGGSDFYSGAANGRAYKISYNRPFATRAGIEARDFYFGAEYPMVRFLERNGYDVSYFSGVDTDRYGSLLKNHKTFLSVGHDEYWSGGQRKNVEAARDAGVNLQFLSGNEVYWHTRYEPSGTGGNDYRTLVSYKETWSNAKIDPSREWTGTWRDPRFASAENGAGRPENALTGTAYMVNHGDLPVTVDDREGQLRLWRNTSLTNLVAGSKQELAPHTVGYESNEDVPNGFRPPGLIQLSTTKGAVPQYLRDFGNVVTEGETTHHVTLYKAHSGALVFSAGSIQWTWGLDDWHDGDGAPPDSRMQQAEVNLLADMGAQPQTLMDGLAPAAASTDKTPPSVNISTAPTGTVKNGEEITVKGTASDTGGQVAGVEFSTDGGSKWKPANGTTSWQFTTVQHGSGPTPILVRAIDDSANYPQTAASIPVNVTGPFSVFGKTSPSTVDSDDPTSAEFGLRFSPTSDGYVTGVRFYKSKANTGLHNGSLWSLNGQRLATARFTNETEEGWQSVTFDEPVEVLAGTEYVVSYSAPKGHYAADNEYFAYRGTDAPPLSVAGGFGVPAAGVYDTGGGYPASSFERTNYYVDAVFNSAGAVALSAGAHSPADTAVSVPLDARIGATLSKPVASQTVKIKVVDTEGGAVSGTTSYDAQSRHATFEANETLSEGTRYTASIVATDSSGGSVERGASWTFRTVLPTRDLGDCPCEFYPDAKKPDLATIKEDVPLTLGTQFSADAPGTITGLKYYRSPDETSAATGRLYTATGTILAEAKFGGDSVSGWQFAAFDKPVHVTAGTDYVAAYVSSGTYAATPGDLASPLDRGPLHTRSQAGRYTYEAGGFPSTAIAINYMIDVRFTPDALPLSATKRSPDAGATDVDPTTNIQVTFNEDLEPGFSLRVSTPSAVVAGTTSDSANHRTLTFTPDQPLPKNTVVSVAPGGIKGSVTGDAEIPPWSFKTSGDSQAMGSLLGNEEPAATDPGDSSAVELGAKMKTSQDIDVEAIRFFKGPLTTGTHTGSLWDASGARLAQVTFANETATGWQTAFLDRPIRLSAGSTFTVSYHAPAGGYVYTSSSFASGKTSGSLSLEGTNGLYAYGTDSVVPSNSWNDTNYFADIVYAVAPAGNSPSVTAAPPSSAEPSASDEPTTPPSGDATSTPTTEPTAPPSEPSMPTGASWLMEHRQASTYVYSDEPVGVEVGLDVKVDSPITAYGIGVNNAAHDRGSRTAYLYAEDGTLLASADLANGSGTGWQLATFDKPLALKAGSYTLSYYSAEGGYAWEGQTDFSDLRSGPVSAAITNGRFRYSANGGTKPVSTWNSTNYFVDLAFLGGEK